jgi:hypothetical protein
MDLKLPIIAYFLSYGRSRRYSGSLKTAPGVTLQNAQINQYSRKTGATVNAQIFDQTTYRKTRFWLRPEFLKATKLAQAASGRVVVGDLIELLKGFNGAEAWLVLERDFPELVSAKHFENVRTGVRIRSDIATSLFKKVNRKKRESLNEAAAIPASSQKAGGRRTSLRSETLAKMIAPALLEILKLKPDAGSTLVAKALNEKDIKSPMGGKWYPSSAANLLKRCRKLGIIKI